MLSLIIELLTLISLILAIVASALQLGLGFVLRKLWNKWVKRKSSKPV